MDAYTSINPDLQVPKISGREFARYDWTKSERAAFAAAVALGERELTDLSRLQICKVFGVSLGYLNKAIALSVATREAVAAGKVALQDIPTIPTDRVLHKTVVDAGVARVWNTLEPLI
jgi:hypothetical protein